MNRKVADFGLAVCSDATHPRPLGDVTVDCRGDVVDLAEMAACWMHVEQETPRCLAYDLHSDGQIGLQDLKTFLQNWLVVNCR